MWLRSPLETVWPPAQDARIPGARYTYRGWFRLLHATGTALASGSKHSPGASYALGACAAYYKLTADPDAVNLAKEAFAWLDNAAHDPEHGRYFGLCQRS